MKKYRSFMAGVVATLMAVSTVGTALAASSRVEYNKAGISLFGENMYLALGIAAVLLCFWFVYTGKLTPLEFIWAPCVYLYMHALTWRKMIQIGSGKKLNSILGETSRNMLFLGLLLAVALN